MSILNENQLDRDKELASLLQMPLEEVQKLPIATPEAIRISTGEQPENLEDLYHSYEHLNFPAYLRTLMKTSATRRHPELFKLLKSTKNKWCLDFGAGVGTHSIALLGNGNNVVMLDVPGKLEKFATRRTWKRGHRCLTSIHNNDKLPDDYFDVVICSDVLEHVEEPIDELCRIRRAMKVGGILHLLVSTMIKPSSGHFASSIEKWKKEGPAYMKKYFIQEGQTIWRKK